MVKNLQNRIKKLGYIQLDKKHQLKDTKYQYFVI